MFEQDQDQNDMLEITINTKKEIVVETAQKGFPTTAEIKKFSQNFSPLEWSRLCENKRFLDAIMENLVLAQKISNEILGRKCKKIE